MASTAQPHAATPHAYGRAKRRLETILKLKKEPSSPPRPIIENRPPEPASPSPSSEAAAATTNTFRSPRIPVQLCYQDEHVAHSRVEKRLESVAMSPSPHPAWTRRVVAMHR